MKLKITAGTTGRLIRLFIQDTSQTNGAGLSTLVYNTSGLTAYYARVGGTAVSIPLVTTSVGTYASASGVGGGFVAVHSTNMPGLYEFSVPDAALAAGATAVHIMLYGATNMPPTVVEIELDALNYQGGPGGGLPV